MVCENKAVRTDLELFAVSDTHGRSCNIFCLREESLYCFTYPMSYILETLKRNLENLNC